SAPIDWRPRPNLVGTRRNPAILPRIAHWLLDRAPSLGRFDDGLPHPERPAACRRSLLVRIDPDRIIHSRRLGWSLHFRLASRRRGIRRMDFRAEEHDVGSLLPAGNALISAIRRTYGRRDSSQRELHARLLYRFRVLRRGDSEQERDGHAAGRSSGPVLVEARKAVMEPRPVPPASVVRCGNRRRIIYCMGGTPIPGRCRDGFLSERYSARADRGARLLVLSSKISMAAESDVRLSPMGCEPESLVAILFSGRRHCSRYRRMAFA